MPDILQVADLFDLGMNQLRRIIEKSRQMSDMDITEFIKGGGQHSSTMLTVKFRKIRSSSEKGHSQWCFRNNHCFFLPSSICM